MKESDFYKLHIGQKIWWNNRFNSIKSINNQRDTLPGWIKKVEFYEPYSEFFNWDDICQDCSLEPPKEKRSWTVYRYWYSKGQEINYYGWTQEENMNICGDIELIKTETKIITED